ncbi:MAG: hypothetical protein ACRD19_14370 [Terriglobia bacterium]
MAYADNATETQPFLAAATADAVLFKLTGRNSPFGRQLLLPDDATDGVTTDYFQYAVLLKSSPAATPLTRDHSAQAGTDNEARTEAQSSKCAGIGFQDCSIQKDESAAHSILAKNYTLDLRATVNIVVPSAR